MQAILKRPHGLEGTSAGRSDVQSIPSASDSDALFARGGTSIEAPSVCMLFHTASVAATLMLMSSRALRLPSRKYIARRR